MMMSYNFQFLNSIYTDDAAAVRLLIWLNIILLSIILLCFIFRILVPWFKKYSSELREKRKLEEKTGEPEKALNSDSEAAIALALYLYFNEMHDEESDVITVKRVSKTYSPWSSKLYNMRNLR